MGQGQTGKAAGRRAGARWANWGKGVSVIRTGERVNEDGEGRKQAAGRLAGRQGSWGGGVRDLARRLCSSLPRFRLRPAAEHCRDTAVRWTISDSRWMTGGTGVGESQTARGSARQAIGSDRILDDVAFKTLILSTRDQNVRRRPVSDPHTCTQRPKQKDDQKRTDGTKYSSRRRRKEYLCRPRDRRRQTDESRGREYLPARQRAGYKPGREGFRNLAALRPKGMWDAAVGKVREMRRA
jgi:hypothetical protein